MYVATPQELAVKNKPSHFTSSYYTSPRVYAHITHHQGCIDRQRVPACVAQRDLDKDSTKNHYGGESIMIFTIQAVTYVVVKKYPQGMEHAMMAIKDNLLFALSSKSTEPILHVVCI